MHTRVIEFVTDDQAASAAKAAARGLRAGKLVAFPTETVYGIAALATRPKAIKRLREIKSRPDKPFTVHLGDPAEVGRYVRDLPFQARRLVSRAFPGPVTLVVPVGGRLAERRDQAAGLYDLLVKDDLIGLRCPDCRVARLLLGGAGGPVVAPSANAPGARSARSAKEVLAAMDGQIDLLLDGGPTPYGKDSTVVHVGRNGWRILRKGVFDERTIRRLIRLKVLFVCSGNTCRSPMAVGLARKILAEKLECSISRLRGKGVEAHSAGVFGFEGSGASPEAVAAARTFGVDIHRHRSRKLTAGLINDADVVFCMTDFHVDQVRRLVASAGDKVRKLAVSGDIADPIGGGAAAYGRIAESVERALRIRLDEELP